MNARSLRARRGGLVVALASAALVAGVLPSFTGTASAAVGTHGGTGGASLTSVNPQTLLTTSSHVSVKGTGFVPSSIVAVGLCKAGTSTDCDPSSFSFPSAAGDGSIDITYTPSATTIHTTNNETIPCDSTGNCAIGVNSSP